MQRAMGLLAGTALAALATNTQAATIYDVPGFPEAIELTGEIVVGDDIYLDRVLSERDASGQATAYLVLNSPGGLLNQAYAMALAVRARGMATVVSSNGECASACMLVFAAGSVRYALPGALLGVHGASEGRGDGFGSNSSNSGTVRLARDMAFFGAPPKVIAYLVITPSSSMTWLDNDDVAGWVTIVSANVRPSNPAPAPKPAPSYTAGTSMTCTGSKGTYVVNWTSAGVSWKGFVHDVYDSHQHTGTGAWVAKGPTKYGTYQAVFGGPNPRIVFTSDKGNVTDHCWGVQ